VPHNGRRHRLVIYTQMVDRWWKFTLGIGVTLLGLAVGLRILPERLPQYHFILETDLILWVVAGADGYAVLLSVILFSIARSAYVQPCASQLRLMAPFLRMNISYRRSLQACRVEMKHLFPINSYEGSQWGLAG